MSLKKQRKICEIQKYNKLNINQISQFLTHNLDEAVSFYIFDTAFCVDRY